MPHCKTHIKLINPCLIAKHTQNPSLALILRNPSLQNTPPTSLQNPSLQNPSLQIWIHRSQIQNFTHTIFTLSFPLSSLSPFVAWCFSTSPLIRSIVNAHSSTPISTTSNSNLHTITHLTHAKQNPPPEPRRQRNPPPICHDLHH